MEERRKEGVGGLVFKIIFKKEKNLLPHLSNLEDAKKLTYSENWWLQEKKE